MREDIENLLPWYVNDTLDEVDRARVEQALARDADLRAALAFWQQTAQAQRTSAVPAAEDVGLARTLARIHSETTAAPSRPGAERRDETPSWFQRLFGGTWLKPALGAAVAVIVVQGALLARQAPLQYRGAAPPASPTQERGHLVTLRVTFDPAATEGQMRIALAAADARFSDGPSEGGEYRVVVAPEQVDAALLAFRRSGVVSSATPAVE